VPHHPNLYPFLTRVEADLWDQLPADLSALLAILPQADLYRARMRSKWPFSRRSLVSGRDIGRRGQHLVEAPGENRHPSTALAWWIGAMAGRVAELPLDGQLRCSVTKCVPPWLAPHVAGASLW